MVRGFDEFLLLKRVFATSTTLGGVSGVFHGFYSSVDDRSVALMTGHGLSHGLTGACVGMFVPIFAVPAVPISIAAYIYMFGHDNLPYVRKKM